jgi:hypothetical protein
VVVGVGLLQVHHLLVRAVDFHGEVEASAAMHVTHAAEQQDEYGSPLHVTHAAEQQGGYGSLLTLGTALGMNTSGLGMLQELEDAPNFLDSSLALVHWYHGFEQRRQVGHTHQLLEDCLANLRMLLAHQGAGAPLGLHQLDLCSPCSCHYVPERQVECQMMGKDKWNKQLDLMFYEGPCIIQIVL